MTGLEYKLREQARIGATMRARLAAGESFHTHSRKGIATNCGGECDCQAREDLEFVKGTLRGYRRAVERENNIRPPDEASRNMLAYSFGIGGRKLAAQLQQTRNRMAQERKLRAVEGDPPDAASRSMALTFADYLHAKNKGGR